MQTLKEMMKDEEEKERQRELDKLYWEFVNSERYDLESCGDR